MKRIGEHRKLLGVDKDVTLKELKTIYRNTMKDSHPDKFVNDEVGKLEAEEKSYMEEQDKKLSDLTEDDIIELSFKEIRARLTPEQVQKVDKWAEANGFENIDNFFASAESNHPDEQVYFKDYLIQCLL